MLRKTVLLFLILALGVATTEAQSERRKAQIENAVRQVMTEQTAAWNRGDIEGFMKGYWNSPELTFVSGSNVTKGWQPTLERYKKFYDSREKMGELTFSDLEISVLSKDSAVVLGSWKLQRASDAPGGKFTLIFRRFKEGWRVVHDHTS